MTRSPDHFRWPARALVKQGEGAPQLGLAALEIQLIEVSSRFRRRGIATKVVGELAAVDPARTPREPSGSMAPARATGDRGRERGDSGGTFRRARHRLADMVLQSIGRTGCARSLQLDAARHRIENRGTHILPPATWDRCSVYPIIAWQMSTAAWLFAGKR
jgi:hypothetical protein